MINQAAKDGKRSNRRLSAEVQHDLTVRVPVISILIEDDDEFSRAALAHLVGIKFPEAVVHTAATPQATSEICVSNNINIILLDTKKPSANIIDILKFLIDTNHNIRVVIISGTSDKEPLHKSAYANKAYALKKPIDIKDLFTTIASIIFEIQTEYKLL